MLRARFLLDLEHLNIRLVGKWELGSYYLFSAMRHRIARSNGGCHRCSGCSVGLPFELCVVVLNDLVHAGAQEGILPVVVELDDALQQFWPGSPGIVHELAGTREDGLHVG